MGAAIPGRTSRRREGRQEEPFRGPLLERGTKRPKEMGKEVEEEEERSH